MRVELEVTLPFCPACRTEYEPPTSYCTVCGVDLVDSLPPQDQDKDADAGALVELARFSNVSEAEMIKELLEKNEILTVLRGEADPIGVVSGAAPTTLLVEEKDFLRAQELYEAYFAGDGVEEHQSDPGEAE